MLRGVLSAGGTAPVGGSGTTGTIPVWSSGTTLGDSGLQDNGTIVSTTTRALAIGRTSVIGTGSRLNVQLTGTTASGYTAPTNAAALFDCGAATNGGVGIVGGGALGYYFANSSGAYDGGVEYSARKLYLRSQGTQALTVDGGNVGIGTASPGYKLHVKDATNRNMIMTSGTTGMKLTSLTDAGAEADIGVQGNTVQFLVGGTVRGTVGSSALDISTTAGYGLKLPATPGNADTQTLDCYQEVTNWVPTVTFGTGGTVSYTVHTGYYVRVGRLVTFALRVDFTVTTAPTGGDLQITLPVASAVDQYFGSGNFNSLPGSGTQGPLYVSVGVSSTANIRKASATGGSSIASAITASSTFIVTGTYIS